MLASLVQRTQMSIHALAIDHVQVTVTPEAEADARQFYGSVLGLREIAKPDALKARGGCWFEIGGAQLHIAVEKGATGDASRRHVCLRVADLGAARAALTAAGIAIKDEPITADGLSRFFVRDPAGNRLEIGERTGR